MYHTSIIISKQYLLYTPDRKNIVANEKYKPGTITGT